MITHGADTRSRSGNSMTNEVATETVTLALVKGVEGIGVYLNDYRIAGPKPWGGGTTVSKWKVDLADIRRALKGGAS